MSRNQIREWFFFISYQGLQKTQDLKKIYILQIRSKLEQSSVLWHSSITKKCKYNLERVQKSALKIIL